MNILFDTKIATAAPQMEMLLVQADILTEPTSDELWHEIIEAQKDIAAKFPVEAIRHRTAIDGTRTAYKRCGKDPNRYRPSAEALCRRAAKGLDLYRTLAPIDLINLISLLTGHSIGGFDADKIVGTTLTLGVGAEGEPYEAIGRGVLNIAGLPVYRDAVGGIGTPTSDNERTKLSANTRHLLMTINIYAPAEGEYASPEAVANLTRSLLEKYGHATNIQVTHYKIRE